MRIAIVGLLRGFRQGIRGGPERVLKNTIIGAIKYDRSNVYTIIPIGFQESANRISLSNNVIVYPIPYDLSRIPLAHPAWLLARRRLARVITAEQPEVVVCHDPVFTHLLSYRSLQNCVTVLHGAFWEGLSEQYRKIEVMPQLLYRRFIYIPFSFFGLKKSLYIIAVTEYLKAKLPRDLRTKTIVIENPVDDIFFESSKHNYVKNEYDGVIKVLTVGRYDPRKNYEVLIYAIKRLTEVNDKYKNRILVKIIGTQYETPSWYYGNLVNLVQKLKLDKNVVLLEAQNDKQLLLHYLDSDIYVHPSLFEGLPNAIQEAMAIGLPIIASNIGGIPYVIRNGYNGFLFEPNNPEMLAKLIHYLINNPALARTIGENARATAYRWSLSHYVAKLRIALKVLVY